MTRDQVGVTNAAIAEAYTEDGMILPPDATVVKGREAIAKLWKSWIDEGLKNLRPTPRRAAISPTRWATSRWMFPAKMEA